ncbi:hypothetical protein MTsPCn9_25060 [Croceitalea sp. MTPC9]|uniref:hypothetical protein n=1 Tax=unclassified Croceitalea TaxID=2632280 RepID=UPI002B3CB4AA|nr:hypothetical protein MTsPCn6_29470 [Croceitalea sp. MTPC6]GMN17568.1 hypothetical protein MTsPCn9_25060 [Croceitalea sp. MTPC9]
MRLFLRAVSYIFHPLFIPIAGTLAYFALAPYSSLEQQSGNILPIFILTVIIPIIFFLILRNLKLITSVFAPSIKERKYPLFISIGLYLMILYKVIPQNYISELYFFFVGLLTASIAIVLLLFLNFKASIHLFGMGSLLLFLIGLSIHFEINITIAIGLVTLLSGLISTSRLYLKAHTVPELLIGFMVGACSQLLLFKFWL